MDARVILRRSFAKQKSHEGYARHLSMTSYLLIIDH